jgi:transcriptional regulator GlxA family with amidase domain
MTSGGISAGIDLSLHIVKKLCGEETANKTMEYMEYGEAAPKNH